MAVYKITCKKCEGEASIDVIDGQNIIQAWLMQIPIISARYRLDNRWGFECLCGNDTRLTEQENRVIKNKHRPDPADIKKVLKNLEIDTRDTFKMELIQ